MISHFRSCIDCGAPAPDVEFYASVPQRCKGCHRARVASNRAAKPEQFRAYERSRRDLPKRVRARRKYALTDAGRAAHARAARAHTERHPERRRANNAVANALRAGRMVKGTSCSRCGSTGPIDGHHADYSKPLEVEWLCKGCHGATRRIG